MPINNSQLPTTNVWDVQEVQEVDVNSPEFKELLVRMYQNINNIALSVNVRDAACYDTQEYFSGQLFFPNPDVTTLSAKQNLYRGVIRKVINFGTLPNTATKTVAHNITVTALTTFTRIYACSTDPVNFIYIPIPYASPTAAKEIELFVDATNVTIITGSNRTAFTITNVVLEYMEM